MPRSEDRTRPFSNPLHQLLLLLLVVGVGAWGWGGCADQSTTAGFEGIPSVTGALVPETAEEGSPFAVEVWGESRQAGWRLERFDLRTNGEQVVITPMGRFESERPVGPPVSFHGAVQVTAPATGIHTVRIQGDNSYLDFPVHVFPRHAIVHLMVRGGIAGIHEELAIGPDGWAMAFRRGMHPPVRTQLSPEQVDAVRAAFRIHGFWSFENQYLSNIPTADDFFYEITYRDHGEEKRVIAEGVASPEPLQLLVGELRDLIAQIIQNAPAPPAVVGSLDVDPVVAGPGVPRTIRLSLKNTGAAPETLRTPTEQLYDVALMREMGMPGGGGPGGPGDDGPGHHGHHGEEMRFIWNWAFGREFSPEATQLVIPGGEARTFDLAWPGTDNGGAVVGGGRYHVIGILMSDTPVPVRPERLGVEGTPPPPVFPIRIEVQINPREAPQGTARELRLLASNLTDAPITLTFPTAQTYDFHIFDPMRMRPGPIWTWSLGKGFPQVITQVTVPARGSVEYTDWWGGSDDGGMVVGPGVYTLRAVLPVTDGPVPPGSESVRFRVTM